MSMQITAEQPQQPPCSPEILDVVIVGGGLVGGLCALLLAEQGIIPRVLDAAPAIPLSRLDQRDVRVLALSPATLSLLEKTDVWQHIQRACPYTGMQVWIRDGYGSLDLGTAAHEQATANTPQLGSMVEPSVLGVAMQQQLSSVLGQHYQQSVKLARLERLPHHWQLTLSTGEQLHTKLVIAADGAMSSVRQMVGIDVDVLDYKQTAITCAIRTEQPHKHIARQVFLPTGPLALLPMADIQTSVDAEHWVSVVWTVPTDMADELRALSVADLMAQLTQASGHVLGQVMELVSMSAFPLQAKQAKQYHMTGLALIGDAAHVVHPMAGQGVNLGCLDAAALADALAHDAKRGLWAHEQTLQRYARHRRLPSSVMMHGLSLLGWVSRDQGPFLTILRNQGFALLNRSTWFKKQVIVEAAGLKSLNSSH